MVCCLKILNISYKDHICYQRASLCQDPEGNWTARRPPDNRKETQTAVVWSCLPFIRSGQNHLARHSERGRETRQTVKGVGRHNQGMDRPGVRQVPKGSGEQKNGGKWFWSYLCCSNAPSRLRGWVKVVKKIKCKVLNSLLSFFLSCFLSFSTQWGSTAVLKFRSPLLTS